MKFLIVGMGSIGRRHLRILINLGEKDIILLRTHNSTLSDDDLSSFTTETNLEDALAHEPDAVIVSNPTSLHLEVAIPAALAGCHLLLEKPISNSMDRIDELNQSVDIGGGNVLIGYQYRFHPGLQKVKDILVDGTIGRPLSVRAHWGEYLPGWHPWEDYRQSYSARADLGGGVILTLSHPLDYMRWLVGEVKALWAFSGKLGDLDLEVEDTAEIGLRFSRGVYGSLHLSYNQKPTTHRLEVVGTAGSIRWDNSTGITSLYTSEVGDWQNTPAPEGFERNDLFLAQMRHFLAVVRGELEPACTLVDGVKALELALAAKESAASGRLVTL
jgi:predicted dehydrogenase